MSISKGAAGLIACRSLAVKLLSDGNTLVVEVVRREFGIAYHHDHLGRILHDLGFSPQKPQRRALHTVAEANRSAPKCDGSEVAARSPFRRERRW